MSETEIKKKSSGLSLKHKIGYGLGDAGGCMTFAIMGSTFAMYCTDALIRVCLQFCLQYGMSGTLSMTLLWAHLWIKPSLKSITPRANSAPGFSEVHLLSV